MTFFPRKAPGKTLGSWIANEKPYTIAMTLNVVRGEPDVREKKPWCAACANIVRVR